MTRDMFQAIRCAACVAVGCAVLAPVTTDAQSLIDLQTKAERTNYEETSTYEDVTRFLTVVAEASTLIQLTTFGTTTEGRAMPLAIVGHVDGTSPQDVMATGKTRVFILGNIHAGEHSRRRSLRQRGHADVSARRRPGQARGVV